MTNKAIQAVETKVLDYSPDVTIEMVDEELFDVAEAKSKNKIMDRYGMIIRR